MVAARGVLSTCVRQMRLPDADDPAFAAFVRKAADDMEASWRTEPIEMPPGVAIAVCRATFAYMREYPLPRPGTFYNLGLDDVMPVVRAVEAELPGGHMNPTFATILEGRLLDTMKKLRSGAA